MAASPPTAVETALRLFQRYLRQERSLTEATVINYTPVVAGEGPGFAVVSVSETGIGVASQDLAHIFDRFWRADKAHRDMWRGNSERVAALEQQIRNNIRAAPDR